MIAKVCMRFSYLTQRVDIMRKLHVLRGGVWKMVFCYKQGEIVCTDNAANALPSRAMWAPDDLAYFQGKFGNDTFCLMFPEGN